MADAISKTADRVSKAVSPDLSAAQAFAARRQVMSEIEKEYQQKTGLRCNITPLYQGGLYHLETTHSPESPTAWASFATGVNAGKHNIYDFLVRDTKTYMPDLGMVHYSVALQIINLGVLAQFQLDKVLFGSMLAL